jgi:exosortase H (IPTLxxWG-CTERM-specific)
MRRFFLLFLLIQGVLFSVEVMHVVQQTVIIPWTELIAAISAWLIQLVDSQVLANGVIIQSTVNGFGVAIRPGCNGVEAAIILAAAIFAFPTHAWRQKLLGFAIGVITIQGLNLIRIISLFYLGQWNQTAFEWAHHYIWEVLIMLDVLMVFLIWIRMLPPSPSVHHAQ